MEKGTAMSFWDHLEDLRRALFRSVSAVGLTSAAAFCMKSLLFDVIIMAPSRGDFPVYRLLRTDFSMSLVNLELSAQFMLHIKAALSAGLVLSFPYIIWEIWRFVAPGLYEREKKALRKTFVMSAFFFYAGVAAGYFLVLPFALSFFQNYSVSEEIRNTISLSSYVSTLFSTVLMFGIVFEFPSVVAALSSLGILTKEGLRKGRKYAFVGSLVLGAIVTPADPLSMFVAAAPLYLLYELSVLFCRPARGD